MELNDYQKHAMETLIPGCYNFDYMGYGLSSEVGEVCGKIAKAIRKQQLEIDHDSYIIESATLKEDIKAELGDVLWFVAGMCHVLDITMEDVAEYNLEKLKSRKERGKIIGDGDHR